MPLPQGLQKLKYGWLGRRRDLKFTLHFGAVGGPALPDEFIRPDAQEIENQTTTQFCVGFATSEAAETKAGKLFDPLFSIQKINLLQGIQIPYQGADIRTGMMAGYTFGFLDKAYGPFQIGVQDPDFIANPKNWDPTLDAIAVKNKWPSFFSVDGDQDIFDNFRSALFLHDQATADEKSDIVFGIRWRAAWDGAVASAGIIPDTYDQKSPYTLHCMVAKDWHIVNGVVRIRLQQSEGKNSQYAGPDGYCYVSRETLNREANIAIYGAFMPSSVVDASQVKALQWNLITKLCNLLLTLYEAVTKGARGILNR